MTVRTTAIRRIDGPLLFLDPVPGIMHGEMVRVAARGNSPALLGRCTIASEEGLVIETFHGTDGMSIKGTTVEFSGSLLTLPVASAMIGRVFDGLGRPVDGMLPVIAESWEDVNGTPINPYSRAYPRDLIETGVSSIDVIATIVRGQKLPIFSGQGLPHDALAARIVKHATIPASDAGQHPFLVIFTGIGIKNDTALYFKNELERTASDTIMFLNLASDPTIERLLAPRIALSTAEFFAFKKGYHVLTILTDMTNYCEALRELSASKDEIPGRKGYPGYMYSDLASIYERAGRIKGIDGSITQVPIITMPNDDIGHPVPDLTGFITEGQIVLNRGLHGKNVTPPIDILSSLSRLMKDAVKGQTRADHEDVVGQLYDAYTRALDVRALQSIVGDEGLTPTDHAYLTFAGRFETGFLSQDSNVRRSFNESLDVAWDVLSSLPRAELTRAKPDHVAMHHKEG